MKSSLIPFADRLLILPEDPETRVGSMQIPETQVTRPSKGRVIQVGPGRVSETGVRILPECTAGDVVSFPTYAGIPFQDDLGDGYRVYLLVRQDELLLNHGPAASENPLV